ncbi:hypothetical protein GC173_10375 [bacterium]|nr:hypothetical protein [bacterium]
MFIFVVTPMIGLSLPALVPIVTAVAGAMGYKVLVDMKDGGDINDALRQRLEETTTVEVKLTDSVLDQLRGEVQRGKALYFERDGIMVALIIDERGRFRVEASGPQEANRRDLEAAGREFVENLAQLFAYNRATEVITRLNAEVLEEERLENGEIRLRIGRWTDREGTE